MSFKIYFALLVALLVCLQSVSAGRRHSPSLENEEDSNPQPNEDNEDSAIKLPIKEPSKYMRNKPTKRPEEFKDVVKSDPKRKSIKYVEGHNYSKIKKLTEDIKKKPTKGPETSQNTAKRNWGKEVIYDNDIGDFEELKKRTKKIQKFKTSRPKPIKDDPDCDDDDDCDDECDDECDDDDEGPDGESRFFLFDWIDSIGNWLSGSSSKVTTTPAPQIAAPNITNNVFVPSEPSLMKAHSQSAGIGDLPAIGPQDPQRNWGPRYLDYGAVPPSRSDLDYRYSDYMSYDGPPNGFVGSRGGPLRRTLRSPEPDEDRKSSAGKRREPIHLIRDSEGKIVQITPENVNILAKKRTPKPKPSKTTTSAPTTAGPSSSAAPEQTGTPERAETTKAPTTKLPESTAAPQQSETTSAPSGAPAVSTTSTSKPHDATAAPAG